MSHDAAAPQLRSEPPRLKRAIGILLALAVVGVIAGLVLRSYQYHKLVAWTAGQELPFVHVMKPQTSDGQHELTLPAHFSPWTVAPIRAQVSGYLQSWNYDIGSHVKAGDLLASIDTPDLDQQLAQAKADLVRAQANYKLAQVTSARWQHLLVSNSVSKQEADEKTASAAATLADVLASKANVDRLDALESFKHIVAPFSGVITARPNDTTNVGNLIIANNGNLPELFTLADTSRLRLYVPIPQSYAGSIHAGMQATLSVLEHPGKEFTATLLNNSRSVNQQSGTLLAQFEVDNADGELLPGDFAEVQIPVKTDKNILMVPASALIFRDAGAQVAVLGPNDRVTLRDVHIRQDLGDVLEIDRGIAPDDRIVNHPPDSLATGDQVRVATQPQEGPVHERGAA